MKRSDLLTSAAKFSAGPPLVPRQPQRVDASRLLPIKSGPDGRAYLATPRGNVKLRWADGTSVTSAQIVSGTKVSIDQKTGLVKLVVGA